MAYIIPPFIYRWLVRRRDGRLRTAPVTLGQLLRTGWFRVLLAAELLGAILLRLVSGNSRRLLGRYIRRVAGWDLRHLPGIGFRAAPLPAGAQVIASRYHADVDLLAAAAAGAGIVADRRFPALISALLRTTHALVPAGSADEACRRGWQVVCFGPLPDGLHAPVIPMGIHGSGDLYPDGGPLLERGSLRVEYGAPVAAGAAAVAVGTLEDAMRMRFGTARYYAPQVLARYRYKGPEVEARAAGCCAAAAPSADGSTAAALHARPSSSITVRGSSDCSWPSCIPDARSTSSSRMRTGLPWPVTLRHNLPTCIPAATAIPPLASSPVRCGS